MVQDTTIEGTSFAADEHLDFLRGLAYDETLRAELQARPVETLAKYGIEIDAASLPADIRLPEADQVEQAFNLGSLADLLTAWFPFLDGGLEN